MRRPLLLIGAAVAVVVCTAQAIASTATVGISATLAANAGIQVVQPLVLPTVSATAIASGSTVSSSGLTAVSGSAVVSSGSTAVTGATSTAGSAVVSASGATATGNSATTAINAPTTGNATLTIHGQAGDTVSTAVPDSFQVVRSGGTDTLTVKTNTNVQSTLSDNGVILGGTVMSRDTLSVDIGGSIALASNGPVTPGPYEGLLVVVVQYN